MRKETAISIGKGIAIVGIGIGIMTELSRWGFSEVIRKGVRNEQNGFCASCHKRNGFLEVHHILPQKYGGADVWENAVGLCRKCHQYWDGESDRGRIFPGKSINMATRLQRK